MSNGNMDATMCNPLYGGCSDFSDDHDDCDIEWHHDSRFPSIDFTDPWRQIWGRKAFDIVSKV